MSLINDMLKDLDAQRTRPTAAHASALRGLGLAGPAGSTRNNTALALYGCGLVLVTVLALPWVIDLVKQPAASRTTALEIPEQVTRTVRVEPAPAAREDATQTSVEIVTEDETPSGAAITAAADADTSRQQTEADQPGSTPVHTESVAVQAESEQPAEVQPLQAVGRQIEIIERPPTPEQQQQHAYNDAVVALRKGNYAEAMRQLQQVLALNSGHKQARLMLANIYLQQQQQTEAESLLATGLAQDPRHAPFAMLYAQLLLAQTREQEAIQSLQTALPGAGQDAEYHAFLAALYQRTGDPAAAVRLYEIALRHLPVKGEWWMGLGISQEQSGNLPAAYAAYQRALQYPLKAVLQQYIQTRLKILSR